MKVKIIVIVDNDLGEEGIIMKQKDNIKYAEEKAKEIYQKFNDLEENIANQKYVKN